MKKISWLVVIMCLTMIIFNQPLMKLGASLNVDTGITHYQLVVDGVKKDIYTFNKDINEILEKEEIELKNKDYIAKNIVDKKTKIEVIRCHEEFIEEKQEIAYEKEVKYDKEIKKGVRNIVEQGETGEKVIQYGVVYENGKEKERYVKDEKVIKEPKKEVIVEGQKEVIVVASRSNLTAKQVLTMRSTAYTHTGNRTATGTYPGVGTIAVDPRVIPLGTRVFVEGYGNAVARDTGGAIKGNIIDVFLNSKGECNKWGRRTVKVYILD
ncbi:3D (Asp-Asp-Asp) domain-containing protein [Desulfonispora thiosulfatigenes DSM 11270]|uniref:3D (Asp-Asp-Asp) domain-containing protein n=1 Tax=Desulfonispora thiosulfatigenes DSM 11270 TaxID=656914 RepID=A0A1W1V0K7_DESTI|nr:3D domain-containing protein [Desulfonispora thiosulfatigenes]SMB86859.1 3D (Asp-Asp-Asp) domain-containing protein [Desulfonispora thiosulfatigenes DSM 11270]